MLAEVYRARDGVVLPLQSTGTSGMEAGIANLVQPGDTVIVGVAGYFGARIAEIVGPPRRACRRGRSRQGGSYVPNEAGRSARVDPEAGARLVAAVHAEELLDRRPARPRGSSARRCKAPICCCMAVCRVMMLGGVPLELRRLARWTPCAYKRKKKRLGAPPGKTSLAISRQASSVIDAREAAGSVPARPAPCCAATGMDPPGRPTTTPRRSCTSDAPLHETLRRGALEEGVERRGTPMERAGRRFAARAEEAQASRCSPRSAIGSCRSTRVARCPTAWTVRTRQPMTLAEQRLEVGGGLGAATSSILQGWPHGAECDRGETADDVSTSSAGVLERRGSSPSSVDLDIDDLPGVRWVRRARSAKSSKTRASSGAPFGGIERETIERAARSIPDEAAGSGCDAARSSPGARRLRSLRPS